MDDLDAGLLFFYNGSVWCDYRSLLSESCGEFHSRAALTTTVFVLPPLGGVAPSLHKIEQETCRRSGPKQRRQQRNDGPTSLLCTVIVAIVYVVLLLIVCPESEWSASVRFFVFRDHTMFQRTNLRKRRYHVLL